MRSPTRSSKETRHFFETVHIVVIVLSRHRYPPGPFAAGSKLRNTVCTVREIYCTILTDHKIFAFMYPVQYLENIGPGIH